MGRSFYAVRVARKKLGIENPFLMVKPWTEQERRMLGTEPDRAVAQKLGRAWKSVIHERNSLGIPAVRIVPQWKEQETRLVGTEPDKVIAEKLGRTLRSVIHKRHALGLPSYAP